MLPGLPASIIETMVKIISETKNEALATLALLNIGQAFSVDKELEEKSAEMTAFVIETCMTRPNLAEPAIYVLQKIALSFPASLTWDPTLLQCLSNRHGKVAAAVCRLMADWLQASLPNGQNDDEDEYV